LFAVFNLILYMYIRLDVIFKVFYMQYLIIDLFA
jgi:hypothetical protein